jgi:hypothetical protein
MAGQAAAGRAHAPRECSAGTLHRARGATIRARRMDFGRMVGMTGPGTPSLMIAAILCTPVLSGSEIAAIICKFSVVSMPIRRPTCRASAGNHRLNILSRRYSGRSVRLDNWRSLLASTDRRRQEGVLGRLQTYQSARSQSRCRLPGASPPSPAEGWAQAALQWREAFADFVNTALTNRAYHLLVAFKRWHPADEDGPSG